MWLLYITKYCHNNYTTASVGVIVGFKGISRFGELEKGYCMGLMSNLTLLGGVTVYGKAFGTYTRRRFVVDCHISLIVLKRCHHFLHLRVMLRTNKPSVCLSVCLSDGRPECLMSACLPACLPNCMSACLSICSFCCPDIYLCLVSIFSHIKFTGFY